ncbi:hypothetical protein [Streptomyces luteireticuli]|uniref:hypothetical protein n=1 Tax=Streptomyces luteireticuli TaxID=173858 RepID=UPI00355880B8
MPLTGHGVSAALADLAAALGTTDMTWPRHDDEDFVELRALAWARCRDRLPDRPEHRPLPDAERARLLSTFTATVGTGPETADTIRSLAELFLDYGENYITTGPLAWSPGQAVLFLADWLPCKAVLDHDQRTLLPDVLKQWVRFALTERGVEPRWIAPRHRSRRGPPARLPGRLRRPLRLGPGQTDRRPPHRPRHRPHRPERRRHRHPHPQR